MKLALFQGKIYIQNTKEEYEIVKGLPNSRFDKKKSAWVVPLNLEMLERLQKGLKLPDKLELERQRLQKKQMLIDKERMVKKPIPLREFPVKIKLYEHQVRAVNMALYALDLEE